MKKPLVCFLLLFAFFNFSFAEHDLNGTTYNHNIYDSNYSYTDDFLGDHDGNHSYPSDPGDWNETDEPTFPPSDDVETFHFVEQTVSGILISWEDVTYGDYGRYSLTLMDGDRELYYGGHSRGAADVNYNQFSLNGDEILTGHFTEYDPLTGVFIKEYSWFEINLGDIYGGPDDDGNHSNPDTGTGDLIGDYDSNHSNPDTGTGELIGDYDSNHSNPDTGTGDLLGDYDSNHSNPDTGSGDLIGDYDGNHSNPDTGSGDLIGDYDGNHTAGPLPPSEGNETKPFDSIQIINSSLRGYVGDGDEALVYGFSLEAKQKVFITVRGPSNGLSLDDPKISLIDSSGQEIAENDDWSSAFNSPEIESRVSIALERSESALLLDLDAGAYSLVVRPYERSQSGSAVIDVQASGIANISIRGLTDSENLFIHGIIVSGTIASSETIDVLAAAKGAATLEKYGVSNGLQDPSITLNSVAGSTIAENDSWVQSGELSRIRGFEKPQGDNEAVLINSLSEGAYMFTVGGSSGREKSAVLHEVFNLGTGSEDDEVTTGEGKAPDSLSGLIMSYNEIEIDANGSELDLGWSDVKFDDNFVYSREFDFDSATWEEYQDQYSYDKTGESTATLVITSEDDGQTTIDLFFESDTDGNGQWKEVSFMDRTTADFILNSMMKNQLLYNLQLSLTDHWTRTTR
jgi:hypothetical protein